jgi:hypothetical protein
MPQTVVRIEDREDGGLMIVPISIQEGPAAKTEDDVSIPQRGTCHTLNEMKRRDPPGN